MRSRTRCWRGEVSQTPAAISHVLRKPFLFGRVVCTGEPLSVRGNHPGVKWILVDFQAFSFKGGSGFPVCQISPWKALDSSRTKKRREGKVGSGYEWWGRKFSRILFRLGKEGLEKNDVSKDSPAEKSTFLDVLPEYTCRACLGARLCAKFL